MKSGYEIIIELLLNNSADVNAQGEYFGNSVQAASLGGYETIARLLLSNGADVNAQVGHFDNALQAASSMNRNTIVGLLLKNGADVNIEGGEFRIPLQAASDEGCRSILSYPTMATLYRYRESDNTALTKPNLETYGLEFKLFETASASASSIRTPVISSVC